MSDLTKKIISKSNERNSMLSLLPAIHSKKVHELDRLNDIELIKRYRYDGDIESRNFLVLRYMALYHKLAFNYRNALPIDETIQICAINCMYVIEKFKFDKNLTSISTILYKSLPNAIRSQLRVNKRNSFVSLDEQLYDNENESGHISYLYDSPDVNLDRLHKDDNSFALRYAINTLNLDKNKTEHKVLTMYYGIGLDRRYNQQEIADRLNLTQGTVSRALSSCHMKLRKILKEQGYTAENML